jgi:hypothetical protein
MEDDNLTFNKGKLRMPINLPFYHSLYEVAFLVQSKILYLELKIILPNIVLLFIPGTVFFANPKSDILTYPS